MTTNFVEDKEIVIRTYNDSLKEHGAGSSRAVTWGSNESQWSRFEALCRIDPVFQPNGPKDDVTLLDLGCGLADLYCYFRGSQEDMSHIEYEGWDINEKLIETAKGRWPNADVYVRDILNNPIHMYDGIFDYTFASGTLGIRTPHWFDWTMDILKEMFRISKKGIAFNFISSYSGGDSASHYVDPCNMLDWLIKNLSPIVTLHHMGYHHQDMTFMVYHENEYPEFSP